MKNNSTAERTRTKSSRATRILRRHNGSTRGVAVTLAFLLAFSALGANLSSILNLMEAMAASSDKYYDGTVILYDYYTDHEIKGSGGDNNAYDGVNRNQIFNAALYESGYVSKAGSWNGGSMEYFPLYLGLQFPYQSQRNQMILDSKNKYKYSIIANSQAGTGTTSYAAQGLVNTTLTAGKVTQGSDHVVLPYFDESFLATKANTLSKSARKAYGISDNNTHTLGSVSPKHTFRFKKVGSYYVYDAGTQGLDFSGSKTTGGTFTAGEGDRQHSIEIPNNGYTGNGYSFLPYATMGEGQNYGFGAEFEIPFTMSSNGYMTKLKNGVISEDDTTPITFEFSGDDDVWVFIDDTLVLDIGGAHGKVSGEIDFGNKRIWVDRVKGENGKYQQNGNATDLRTYYDNGNKVYTDATALLDGLSLYNDPTKTHTLKLFYIERGSLESNCKITFNFQIADMVSVKNTVDTSPVTDPSLRAATDAAVYREGVEYQMASNSPTSSIYSPDAGTNRHHEEVVPTKYTLSFDLGDPDFGSIDSERYAGGTHVSLPSSGPNVTREGWHIAGWSATAGGAAVETPYVMPSSDTTLYAIWEENPIAPFEYPPKPALFYVDGLEGHKITRIYQNGSDAAGYGNDSQYRTAIGNLTHVELQYNEAKFFYTTQTSNYGDCQHPRDDTYIDYAGKSGYYCEKRGNDLLVGGPNRKESDGTMNPSGIYIYQMTSYNHSGGSNTATTKLDKYDIDHTGTFAPETNADNWIKAYIKLYKDLCDWADDANQNEAMLRNENLRNQYTQAVEDYKTLQYLQHVSDNQYTYTNPAKVYTDFVATTTNYELSYSDSVTFYIYSASQPAVASANNYSTTYNVVNSPDYSDTKAYTASSFDASSLNPVDNGSGSYYQVTVDKNVLRTNANNASDVTTLDNNIAITVGGETKNIKAAEVSAFNYQYPCYYFTEGVTKNIPDGWDQYGFDDYKTVWFYSTSNISGQTVLCTNTYDNTTTKSNTLTADGDIPGYYYAVVPVTAVHKNQGTKETQAVSMKLNGNDVGFSSTPQGYSVPCYYDTSSNGGWQELRTVVAEAPSWWQNMSLYFHKCNRICSEMERKHRFQLLR